MYPGDNDFVMIPEDATDARIVFEALVHCEVCLDAMVSDFMLFCVCQATLGAPIPQA
jgi:hypothetical protein